MIKQVTVTLVAMMSLSLVSCGNEKKFPTSKGSDQIPMPQAYPHATKAPGKDLEPTGIAQELVYTIYTVNQIQCLQSDKEIQADPKLPAFDQYFELQAITKIWRENSKQDALQYIAAFITADTTRSEEINNLRDSQYSNISLKKEQYKIIGAEIAKDAGMLNEQFKQALLTPEEYPEQFKELVSDKLIQLQSLQDEIDQIKAQIQIEDDALISSLHFHGRI